MEEEDDADVAVVRSLREQIGDFLTILRFQHKVVEYEQAGLARNVVGVEAGRHTTDECDVRYCPYVHTKGLLRSVEPYDVVEARYALGSEQLESEVRFATPRGTNYH